VKVLAARTGDCHCELPNATAIVNRDREYFMVWLAQNWIWVATLFGSLAVLMFGRRGNGVIAMAAMPNTVSATSCTIIHPNGCGRPNAVNFYRRVP